jgi:hypothetical protein
MLTVVQWKIVGIAVLLVLVSLILAWSVSSTAVYIALDILVRSRNMTSLTDWISMIREYPGLSSIDYSLDPAERLVEPHFILANHIHSHYRLGTYISMALITPMTRKSRIVCFREYSYMKDRIPFVGGFISETMNAILSDEITVDKTLDREEKERLLVQSIRESFDAGQNVMWFIDDVEADHPVVKTFIKKVLGYFPSRTKQLVHMYEPSDNRTFGYYRYPATKDLNRIIALHEHKPMGDTGVTP